MNLVWLGQAGFYLVCDSGVRVMIDPYLSDALFLKNGDRHRRLVPIDPEYLHAAADVLILTHAHEDHTDLMTLDQIFETNRDIAVLSPGNVQSILRSRYGTAEEWMLFEPGTEITLKQILFRATYAMHSDACPIGVVIEEKGKYYCHTGDTMYHSRLQEEYPVNAELLALPINGKGNNMNAADAARLTAKLMPKRVFPMHWDMFESYAGDVNEFVDCLGPTETEILCSRQYEMTEIQGAAEQ